MTPEQQLILTIIAVSIAGASLLLSMFSIGWNVYRDIVLKPRLNVRFSLSQLHHQTFDEPITTLVLHVTNHGPGKTKCNMMHLKAVSLWRRLLRRTKYAVLLHDYENPLSGKLPAWLEVGEGVDLLIRYDSDCFLAEDVTHIGISDVFGRIHWAPRKQVSKAKKDFQKDFQAKKSEQSPAGAA